MKITAISDLHGYLPKLPGGDLLILAGDYTSSDKVKQWAEFFAWLKKQKYTKKILVAGNHDHLLEKGFPKHQKEADDLKEVQEFLEINEDFEYLCDSSTEYNGLKIWGSPHSLWFQGINPKCTAFSTDETTLKKHYNKIPCDIDILVTHTPPWGMLDRNLNNESCGSLSLRNHTLCRERFTNLKLHVFGHIHEEGGKMFETTFCKFVNASIMNEFYIPKNKIITLEL